MRVISGRMRRIIPNKVKCLNKCLRRKESRIQNLKQRLLQSRSTKAEKEVRSLKKKQLAEKTKLIRLENPLKDMEKEMEQTEDTNDDLIRCTPMGWTGIYN